MSTELEGTQAATTIGQTTANTGAAAGKGATLKAAEIELAEAAPAAKGGAGVGAGAKATGAAGKGAAAGKTMGLGKAAGSASGTTLATKAGGAAGVGMTAKGVATGGTIWTGSGYSLGLGLGLGMWGPMVVAGLGALLLAGAYTFVKLRQPKPPESV